MGKARKAGLSRTVRVRTFEGSLKPRNNYYGLLVRQHKRECAQQRYEQNIAGLGSESLQALAEIHTSASGSMMLDDFSIMNDDPSGPWEDVPDPDDLVACTARDIIDTALALDLPKPTLDWSHVSHYTFLEDFVLIRDTNRDISDRPWAKPVILRWLHTSIIDEERHFTKRLQEIEASGQPVYGAVNDFVTCRHCVNAELLIKISQIYSLPGFTGVPSPGIKKGSMPVDTLTRTDDIAEITSNLGKVSQILDVDVPEVEDDDDDDTDMLNGIVNFLGDLSSST
ncbi:hypothetical protein C0993_010602 [Termitomyces sp. T159_Od127]|nr:hypothetical protein C0993_010602 [Termitomyces sp. T159_Od127]